MERRLRMFQVLIETEYNYRHAAREYRRKYPNEEAPAHTSFLRLEIRYNLYKQSVHISSKILTI